MGSMSPPSFPPAQRAKLNEMVLQAYTDLSDSQREDLERRFAAMDVDGDERITLEEATRFFRELYLEQGMTKLAADIGGLMQAMWALLDADGSGALDKMELGALALLQNAATCSGCRAPILDETFNACTACWGAWLGLKVEQRRSSWELQAAWCARCDADAAGGSKKHTCSAPKVEPVKNEWTKPVDHWAISKQLTKGPKGVSVTCECCGDRHGSAAPGYATDDCEHVYIAPEGGYLCEWCVCWICCSCARESEDLMAPAVGQWRALCLCHSCSGKPNQHRHFPRYKMQSRAFKPNDAHCPTCQPLLLEGALELKFIGPNEGLGGRQPSVHVVQKGNDARWAQREKAKAAQERMDVASSTASLALDLVQMCVVQ